MLMWIVLSLGGAALLATMLLLFVPAYHAGVDPALVLFYVWAVGAPCIFVYIKLRRIPLRVPRTARTWLVGAIFTSFLGNLCYLTAMSRAPNPGYPGAIEGSKMLVVTLVSVWLFSSHFSWLKGLGALCCAIGLALICL